jgi:ParB-like chromosome segregation protein Spo0J
VLINPITARPLDGAGYWLIAGRHRLAAVKKPQEADIRCNVLDDMAAQLS